ncbi:MAG: winged helix-turn-helix domain-containing protein [Nanobdellota archaeon]
MAEYDNQDKAIIKELIVNPRLSDNKVSRITGIPVKTVNRKRKRLETNGVLNYFVHVENGPEGTGKFGAKAQFMVIFRQGITRQSFFENLNRVGFSYLDIKHIKTANVGEYEGRLALILLIESRVQSDLLEVFNSEIFVKLQSMLGHDCVYKVNVVYVHTDLVNLHNYIKGYNISNGKIKEDWPADKIYTWE